MSNRGRRVKSLMSLVALATAGAAMNATPAAGQGVAGEPPLAASSNVRHVANLPGSAAGMNFKDHYAYVSGWGGITVLDIAQADSPQLVGVLPLPHFENEDVDLCGNTLIVVNDRVASDLGSIMYVVSIANPTSPVVSAVLPLGLTGERPRLGPHRELRQARLLAGVGRRRQTWWRSSISRSRPHRGRWASSSRPRP